MSMGQGTRSRLVRRDVLELQTPQFYFAPGDTNVFTGSATVSRLESQARLNAKKREENVPFSREDDRYMIRYGAL
jgi:hypothetical protein